MTPEEAIKRMTEEVVRLRDKGNDYLDYLADAEQLGIEAMKRFMEFRHAGIIGAYKLLPGETAERAQ